MTNTRFLGFLVTAVSLMWSLTCPAQTPAPATRPGAPESLVQAINVADKELSFAWLEGLDIPDEVRRIARADLPVGVVEAADHWARKIINPDYLPAAGAGLQWEGRPDVLRAERRLPDGRVFGRLVSDCLLLEYELDGTTMRVSENGGCLSIRVRLNRHRELLGAEDAEGFLREKALDLLRLPMKSHDEMSFDTREHEGV